MPDRSSDWFNQAIHNLAHARECAAAGRHDWACFVSQQAAESAVKAVYFRQGEEAWGHVVRKLLEGLVPNISVPEGLLDSARVLDLYYIPTRYPNGHAAGAPHEHFGKLQSEEAIRHAGQIIEFCRLQMAEP